jgi:uncharacterized DUF497 family protein
LVVAPLLSSLTLVMAHLFYTGGPYIVQNGDFEWDDAKAARNVREHKVTFEMARLAFKDAFAFEREDCREHYDEDRYTLIGMVQDRALCVAYSVRKARIRIISARYAEPYEKRLYHEHNTQE